MATKIGEAFLSVRGQPDIPGIKSAGQRGGSVFAGAFKAILSAQLVQQGLRAVRDFATDVIGAGRENVRVAAITAQAIKTTGGAAGVTAGQVAKLTASLSKTNGVAQSTIQTSSNLLLTFTNIKNTGPHKIFDRASAAIVDMTAALNDGEVNTSTLKSSSIQLGKALNDPIKGITALSRVGVSFTDQQKKQIAAMVEAGDTAGAQTLILKELEKEFGGAGAAAADPAKKAAAAWANFKGTLGELVLPAINALSSALSEKVMPVLEGKVLPAVKRFGQFVAAEVVPRVRELAAVWLPRLRTVLAAVGDFIGGTVVPGLAKLAGFISRNKDFFIPFVQILGAALIGFKAFMFIRTVIVAIWAFNVALAANPIGLVVIAIAALVAALIWLWKNNETFRKIVTAAWKGVQVVVSAVVKWFVNTAWPFLQKVWDGILTGVRVLVRAWKLQWNIAVAVVRAVWGFIQDRVRNGVANITAVVTRIRQIVTTVRAAFNAARAAVVDRVGALVSFVRGVPGRIVGALGRLRSRLFGAGMDIIRGLIDGIRNMIGRAAQAARDAVSSAVSAAKNFLGIGSPSKVFAQLGMETMRGYQQGVGREARRTAAAVESGLSVPSTGLRTGTSRPMDEGRIGREFAAMLGRALDGARLVVDDRGRGRLEALQAGYYRRAG